MLTKRKGRTPMYCSDQNPSERRECHKEVAFGVCLLLALWGVSMVLTAQPPTIMDITHEVLMQANMSDIDHQVTITRINEMLYSDMSLLNQPEEYRDKVEFLVSLVE